MHPTAPNVRHTPNNPDKPFVYKLNPYSFQQRTPSLTKNIRRVETLAKVHSTLKSFRRNFSPKPQFISALQNQLSSPSPSPSSLLPPPHPNRSYSPSNYYNQSHPTNPNPDHSEYFSTPNPKRPTKKNSFSLSQKWIHGLRSPLNSLRKTREDLTLKVSY